MDYYNYSEVLKIVEDFMEQSGIRQYCEEVCKGGCCQGCRLCYNLLEPRHLPCSIYLCSMLTDDIFNKKLRKLWGEAEESISESYRVIMIDRGRITDIYRETPFMNVLNRSYMAGRKPIDKFIKRANLELIKKRMLKKRYKNFASVYNKGFYEREYKGRIK